jgi:ribonuclease P protein component
VSVGAAPPIGRLVRSADFERVLSSRSRAQSVHFALHHVPGTPSVAHRPSSGPVADKLSTGRSTGLSDAVDDSPFPGLPTALRAATGRTRLSLWLGAVVPKRHARRAVTRTLLKRQIKAAVATHAGALPAGLWVVRLRAGFDRAAFPSAASTALRRAARDELDQLLAASAATRAPA